MNNLTAQRRLWLIAPAMLALLAALWAALLRLGWTLPSPGPQVVGNHGPLMVSGFLGTLIGLERAVALGRRWAYAAPALTGLGALCLLAGLPTLVGAALTTAGSLVFVAALVAIVRRQAALFTGVAVPAGAAWFVGNLLWLAGGSVSVAVPWWAGSLVLTIAAERLELSRVLQHTPAQRATFSAAAATLLAGITLCLVLPAAGVRLAGVGLIALAAWLFRYDVARRTVRLPGLPRFIAVCLLAGYVWLVVAGLLAISFGAAMTALRYDAVLHAVFLGFVMSMIFGHAPVIFPALLAVAVPFRPTFYLHLGSLHLALLLREVGDLAGLGGLHRWGGLLTEVALLLFLGGTLAAVRSARPPEAHRHSRGWKLNQRF